VLWQINYWSVFVLNWFILPTLNEYNKAGDFTKREKIMRALRNNIPFLVICFFAFIGLIIFLALTGPG